MSAPTAPSGRGLGAVRRPVRQSPRMSLFAPPFALATGVPNRADNSALLLPPLNQGSEGCCTGHAHALMFSYLLAKSGKKVFEGSPSFNYWFSRKRELPARTDPSQDTGANPQDALISLANEGLCSVEDMPYSDMDWTTKPSIKQRFDARHHRVTGASIIPQDLLHVRAFLASGFVFCLGIAVYASFEMVGGNGAVPMPSPGEQLLGFHNVLAYGYQDADQPGDGTLLCQNSWGSGWGNGGRFTLPYAYVTSSQLSFTFTAGTGIKT